MWQSKGPLWVEADNWFSCAENPRGLSFAALSEIESGPSIASLFVGVFVRPIHLALTTALLAMAQPALAATIYLDCSMPDGKGGQAPWTISLNEEASRVTVTHPIATRTLTASFTPDNIIWDGGDFTLDRTSLVLTRRPTFRGEPLGNPDSGQCKISSRKRAV